MSSPTHDEILRPGKGKWALVLLLSAAFVVIGFLVVSRAHSSHDSLPGRGGIVFFGLCLVVAFIQFIPNSSFLRLGPDGITIRVMWRSAFYRWSDIERFGVAAFTPSHVGFDFSATYPDRDKARTIRKINRTLTGFEAGLPDNYGWNYAELVAHLNRLREQRSA